MNGSQEKRYRRKIKIESFLDLLITTYDILLDKHESDHRSPNRLSFRQQVIELAMNQQHMTNSVQENTFGERHTWKHLRFFV